MADIRRTPGANDAPIESRRAGLPDADLEQPVAPGGDDLPAPDHLEFGELAPESARPTPLDDIAEAEREQMPRD